MIDHEAGRSSAGDATTSIGLIFLGVGLLAVARVVVQLMIQLEEQVRRTENLEGAVASMAASGAIAAKLVMDKLQPRPSSEAASSGK